MALNSEVQPDWLKKSSTFRGKTTLIEEWLYTQRHNQFDWRLKNGSTFRGTTSLIEEWLYIQRYNQFDWRSTHLLSIRPSGVVSKNDMGLRRLLVRRRSWSCLAASMQPKAVEAVRANTPQAARWRHQIFTVKSAFTESHKSGNQMVSDLSWQLAKLC